MLCIHNINNIFNDPIATANISMLRINSQISMLTLAYGLSIVSSLIMWSNAVSDILESITAFSILLCNMHLTVMLAKKLLNANISCLLMEGNGLSSVFCNFERWLNLPPKFYYQSSFHLLISWQVVNLKQKQ